ncbi:MAG: response regulator transcription factor [Gallionellaceae bacterium]
MPPTHILLIDDHAMFRSGLRMVLNAGIPDSVIFEASSLETVNDKNAIDVVVLDIKLPGSSGMEGIAQIKRKWPHVPVLMLSSLDTPETVQLALAHGAAGFISKAETAEKIIEAINLVLRENFDNSSPKETSIAPKHLTQRQNEVLELLGQGLSNKLIARQFFLSENTVRRHVQDILEFFGVASRAEAVVSARRQGLIH